MLSHSGKPLPSQDYFVQTCGRIMRSHAYFYYGKESPNGVIANCDTLPQSALETRILTIRGIQVMVDRDLAEICIHKKYRNPFGFLQGGAPWCPLTFKATAKVTLFLESPIGDPRSGRG